MQTVNLGKHGPAVTALGIGTWSWGDKLFWNYGSDYGPSQVKEAFEAAIAAGITFFDTAEVYGIGKSESLLGEFTGQQQGSIDIATKYGPLPWRLTGDSVAEALSNSLERLQLKQVTLYQVHWPFSFFMTQETLMNALADEVKKGRILTVGVSNYSAEEMRQASDILAKRGVPLAVNQMQYSLLHRNIESNGVLQTAKDLGITILAYSPLAQGLLTGKYDPANPQTPEGARRFDSRFSKGGLAKIAPVLNALKELGAKYNKTCAQVALNWLINQGDVIPIPGAKNAQQATQNAGALGWSLEAGEVAYLSNK
ncbi:MAG: aldo/keto reductase [Spirulinaceae cyanobacterium]